MQEITVIFIQTGELMHLKSASGRFGTCSRHVAGSKMMGGASDKKSSPSTCHIHSIDMSASNPSHPISGMYPYAPRTPVESQLIIVNTGFPLVGVRIMDTFHFWDLRDWMRSCRCCVIIYAHYLERDFFR
jgi:hypothetical protein